MILQILKHDNKNDTLILLWSLESVIQKMETVSDVSTEVSV